MKILISGSSGFIGKPVVSALKAEGHQVFKLVRHKTDKEDEVNWDIKANTIDFEKLERISPEILIHLAGEPILAVGGWTEAKKKEIVDSRIKSGKLISDALLKLKTPPKAILSASGVSYYGSRGEEIVDETSTKGSGFLSDVTVDWEKMWDEVSAKGVPVFSMRIGIVLNPNGGALQSMFVPYYMGLGGVMGSGQQWMSWISLWDVVRIVVFIVKDVGGERKLTPGPINVMGPKPVRNYEFTKTLGRVMWRPTVCWMPEFAIRLAFGNELANETMLASTNALPRKLMNAGFTFCDNNVEEALRHELYTKVGRVTK